MSDRLSALLQHFELKARVFHQGAWRGSADFAAAPGRGHLHLLHLGQLDVTDAQGVRSVLTEPGVLFFPHGGAHRIDTEAEAGTALVCATVEFGVGDENPLLRALPAQLQVPWVSLPGLALTQQLLFDEAFAQRCGHLAVVNRLAEVLLVQVLRYAIEQQLLSTGLIAGLADPRLLKALCAVHDAPDRAWSLDTMAFEAGMSRARFAAHFAQRVGMPPGEYLQSWRLGLARTLLRRGLPVKVVAANVGYANASALGRAFFNKLGTSPAAWQRTQALHVATTLQ